MCNVKCLVDLNPKKSGERSRNGSGTTLNLDFGFCKCHGEMSFKKNIMYIYDGPIILNTFLLISGIQSSSLLGVI